VTHTDTTAGKTPEQFFDLLPEWQGVDEDVFSSGSNASASKSPMRQALEWGAVIVGALIAALIIKTFLFQAFFIPSGSMEDTLQVGDRVLVNKLSYQFGDIERGDIVVFHKPENAGESDVDEFIKRVIGLEGETLRSMDGVVYIDGRPLDEPYLESGIFTSSLNEITVPEGYIFVMGDSRGSSHDSRFFGPIPTDSIVGEAFVRLWPLGSFGGL
jgi:signal peptidase I